MFVVAQEQAQEDQNRRVASAWYVEYFARQKTLKGLKHYLTSKKGPQTVLQQRSVLDVLSRQYGIPVVKAKKGSITH